MKNVVMTLEELMKAKGALDALLALAGIPHKKAYWLDRNRKSLMPTVKKWYTDMQVIGEKYAETIPSFPFIPTEDYHAFKTELFSIIDKTIPEPVTVEGTELKKDIILVFVKYEKASDSAGKKGIPMEDRAVYEKEVNEAVEKFYADLEVYPVELNPDLESVLQKLSGDEQAALSFIFEEESVIKVFGGKVIA